MRNLKKILALVLALVMSLSLMATASAADFKDASDISENYQTAVNVLEGLKVFKGYAEDNTFRPKGEITRAEVATIIYRIATGDAEDAQASIYTNMTTSFTDLDKAEWARGYVNYCHNAQIIKGESATKFNPNGKITGYATLAMILRAMGYGKNGEFEGAQWEYQTAAKAKEIGLIDNVIEAQLGSNAPRELVAEILFRALLTEMVDYTVLNGYVKNGKTLGKEQFGLEKVTGVVMANEWANLNENADDGDEVLADGKTELLLADGTTYLADISSDIDVVGLTCTAYMADQNKDGVREVLTDLTADAINVVADNEGKAVGTGNADQYKKSISALAADESITINADTVYYWNYDRDYFTTSDFLIRYAVAKGTEWIDEYAEDIRVDMSKTAANREFPGHSVESRTVSVDVDRDGKIEAGEKFECWVITITPDYIINGDDRTIMQRIFYTADRLAYITDNNLALNDYIIGEVYVGTASTTDVSDTLSWREFVDKYLVDDNNWQWSWVANGESLRVVDNNGDGKAEYVLGIGYTQDKVIGIREEAPEFHSMQPTKQGYSSIVWDDGVESYEVGTIVNWRLIDNKLAVWKAPVVTDSIKTKSFQKITVTTTESGETYGQSGIDNATLLDDQIMSMADDTKYNMYLDQFGFIRTYELAQGYEYALLTEMYSGVLQNTNYLSNPTAIAEVTIGDETNEYTVNGGASSVFLSRLGAAPNLGNAITWTAGTGLATGRPNYLQPAIAHLTAQGSANGTAAATSYTVWGRQVFSANTGTVNNVPTTSAMFDYGDEKDSNLTTANAAYDDHAYSFTNVGAYALKDDGTINLKTASELATDQNGRQWYYVLTTRDNTATTTANMDKVTSATWSDTKYGKTFSQAMADGDLAPVYAVDYVQLSNNSGVTANQRHFNIEAEYNRKYQNNSNGYVNATVDTEFYLVTPTAIKHVTGYAGLPTINAANIRAAYAVATNTSVDSNGADYWVADVIVIETNKLEQDYDSISLFYWNPSETQAQVRYLNTLNNEWKETGSTDYARMTVIPGGTWGNWSAWAGGYGFYELYNTTFNADDNSLTAGSVTKINRGEYNDHGIYAGALRRDHVIEETSGYVSVNLAGSTTSTTSANITAVDLDAPGNAYSAPIYHVQFNQYGQTTANEIRLVRATWTDVADGDELIWVLDKKTNTAFVVDLAQHANEGATPTWLITKNSSGAVIGGIYKDILDEQTTNVDGYTVTVETTGLPAGLTIAPKQIATITAGLGMTFDFAGNQALVGTYNVPGYRLKSITPVTGTLAGNTSVTTTCTPNNTWASATASVILANMGDNVTITLEYEPAEYNVALTNTPNTVTGGTSITAVTANDNRTPAVAATDILTTPVTDKLVTAYTRDVTVAVTLDQALEDYEEFDITVAGVPANGWRLTGSGTNYQILFTMPSDDVDITIDIVGKTADVTYRLGSATGEILKQDTWAAVTDATSDTYTVAAINGYTVTSWTAYKPGTNGPVQIATGTTVGTDTLAVASGEWAEDITIVLTGTIDEIDVTFTFAAGNVYVGKTNVQDQQTMIATGDTLDNVTVKDTFYFTVSGVTPAPTVAVGTGNATVSAPVKIADDTWMWTVTEAYEATPAGGVTITLT